MGLAARLGALSTTVALVLGAVGCGSSDEAGAAATPRPVVSGVVLDGPDGKPVEGVELELVVWPSPHVQGATKDDTAPEPLRLGDAVSAEDGSFELAADPDDLTPHALTGGLVDLTVQVAGDPGPGTRASVVLGKEAGTGVTTLTPLEGVVVTMSPTPTGSGG